MSKYPLVTLVVLFGLLPVFGFGWRPAAPTEKSGLSQPGSALGVHAPHTDILLKPTATPESAPPAIEQTQVIQTTDHRLLQAMILLTVLIMIVIFWGVWSNRDEAFLR
ncbi:MAG: hypothetical protein B6D39_03415 [Anaerolineae bacterium UTCFX2]|jgi:small neutral amino acid transporter SnatA (MarC family)|nr:hypothetical protein [Anaerolineae bacterium]MCZ7553864.1 hypothetical protein [Anaerolineales bacterium]OQY93153.1 MAG: hypothetical protein B6D39_03415 [Anaerolineae bacterium UTCFX2]